MDSRFPANPGGGVGVVRMGAPGVVGGVHRARGTVLRSLDLPGEAAGLKLGPTVCVSVLGAYIPVVLVVLFIARVVRGSAAD